MIPVSIRRRVGSGTAATVAMMSAATRNSRPSKVARASRSRSTLLSASNASPAMTRRAKLIIAADPPTDTTAMPIASRPWATHSTMTWNAISGSLRHFGHRSRCERGLLRSASTARPRGSDHDVVLTGCGCWNDLVRVVRHECSAIRTWHLLRDLSRFFVDRHLCPSVPQHLGHPNQFADEAVRTPHERIVQQPTVLREDFPHLANVDVPENRDEAQLAHDGQQALNDADPGERTCRHADEANGFVDVLVEAAIERVLQESRKTMVVLGRDNDQTIGGADRLRVCRLFDRFARIIHGKRQRGDIDNGTADAGAAIQQLREELRRVNAGAALAARAENDRNVQRADFIHGRLLSVQRSLDADDSESCRDASSVNTMPRGWICS